MRNFKEIANEVLKKREEKENAIRELASDIIEDALKHFQNPEIRTVYIKYDVDGNSQSDRPKIIIETKTNGERYTNLLYCLFVYREIKNILLKENSEQNCMFEFEIPEYIDDDQGTEIVIRLKNA